MIGSKLVQPINTVIGLVPKSHIDKQCHLYARELRARFYEHFIHSRPKMKSQYDKGAGFAPLTIGDTVMLWKPYKTGHVSHCFQPN